MEFIVAKVKSFRIHPDYGVPDRDIKEYLSVCETEIGIISVTAVYIPPCGEADPRITIMVTRLDEVLEAEA